MTNDKVCMGIILMVALLLFAGNSHAQNSDRANAAISTTFRDSMIREVIEIEKARVIGRADKFLKIKPRTVTASSCPRSIGGRHDFYSEGPYWWPDPANPNGPFIRKDGLRYPGQFRDHDEDLRTFSWITGTCTAAYLLTGKEIYVHAAMEQLNAWFTDTLTRMNPNMLYAQAIRGVNTGRGTGIIDAVPLMDVARSVMILEQSPYVSPAAMVPVREWFRQFITWLTTHPYGIDEMNAKNNHGSWWHAQVAAYATLIGDEKTLQLCKQHYESVLLPHQMAQDGSYPEELARTKPYSYSLFNLDATAALTWILTENGMDCWNFTLSDGRNIRKGLNYMLPYLKDKTRWPGKEDVDKWDAQPEPRQFMLFAAMAGEKKAWFELWKSLNTKNGSEAGRLSQAVKNPLLWLDPFSSAYSANAMKLNHPQTGFPAKSGKSGLLFAENFDTASGNWIAEFENDKKSGLTIADGVMDIRSFRGATVWFNRKLSGNIEISYTETVVDKGGENDRVSDMNAFWMASDPANPNLFTRKGDFKAYDNLELYYAGVGGNDNSTTRFRKYHRDGQKPVLKEYTDKDHLLAGNKKYAVKIICQNGRIQYYRDNELYFDFQDESPYESGYFGIRTTKSHLQISQFKVSQIQ